MSAEAKIIKLNDHFDKERFQKYMKDKEIKRYQNNSCSHNEGFTFDGEIDEVLCDRCKKKWTTFEFMWFQIEKKQSLSYKVFQIENAIHFLNEEKNTIQQEVDELKKERRSLKLELNKLRKL